MVAIGGLEPPTPELWIPCLLCKYLLISRLQDSPSLNLLHTYYSQRRLNSGIVTKLLHRFCDK